MGHTQKQIFLKTLSKQGRDTSETFTAFNKKNAEAIQVNAMRF